MAQLQQEDREWSKLWLLHSLVDTFLGREIWVFRSSLAEECLDPRFLPFSEDALTAELLGIKQVDLLLVLPLAAITYKGPGRHFHTNEVDPNKKPAI